MDFRYQGTELELFAGAKNWKAYFSSFLRPYIKGHILEAGAGSGNTTPYLLDEQVISCLCLEPDPSLSGIIRDKILTKQLPGQCISFTGKIDELAVDQLFDTIIYIDVLEHIEAEKEEILKAISHLNPGGCLLILVPAHSWLYSKFDAQIGHFRRYNRKSLLEVMPVHMLQRKLFYLDSCSLIMSLIQKVFLKQNLPTEKQVMLWDQVFVRISRLSDWICGRRIGKSLVGIWQKESHVNI